MKAAHEAEQENAAEEQHTEDSPEREEESTEEYSYEGEAEEYSYEGEAEEEVDYSAYKEEGDETLDNSLYEPSTDDDSEWEATICMRRDRIWSLPLEQKEGERGLLLVSFDFPSEIWSYQLYSFILIAAWLACIEGA